MSRFINAYYVVNGLLIASYVPIRQQFDTSSLQKPDQYFGIPREIEIVAMVILFIGSKYRKQPTIDAFLSTAILYVKTGLAALYYFMDLRVLGWYLFICLILFIVLKLPKYEGPEDILYLNQESLERRVLNQTCTESWIVYFYADWCERCLHHDPMIASLSLQYSSKHLKFGKIDVARYPELADEYSINPSSTSWQLPTIILFQEGKEVRRLPKLGENGKVIKTILEKKGVLAFFKIETLSEGKASPKTARKTNQTKK